MTALSMETIIFCILFVLLPLLGRGAGGHFGRRSKLCSPVIGVIFGLLLGVTGWALLAFALIGWASEKTSPAKYCTGLITDNFIAVPSRQWAWFEVPFLRANPWIGVTVRGGLSALWYLTLWPVAVVYPMLAYIAAWPLGLYIGTKLPLLSAWDWAEILRPTLVGVCILLWRFGGVIYGS